MGIEEHNFQETFDHYRVKVSFVSLDLVINELEVRFFENYLGNLCESAGVVVSSDPSW